jgi:hypothetical protein
MEESVNAANGHKNAYAPFTLKDAPIENQRPMRVVVVGAGYSGICAAIRYFSHIEYRISRNGLGELVANAIFYRIPEKLRNVDLTVYEKSDGIGGVWYDAGSCSSAPWSGSCWILMSCRWLNRYPGKVTCVAATWSNFSSSN